MRLIDSHCHIPDDAYPVSSEEMLVRAQKAGVEKIITIGTSLEDNKSKINFCVENPNVYCAVGIYPHEEQEFTSDTFNHLVDSLEMQLKSSKKVVGIGECGIDLVQSTGVVHPDSYPMRTLEDQINLFEKQIKLAIEMNLPLVIHNRNGDVHVFNLLTKYKDAGLRGVAHCFASTVEVANNYIDLGFYISFSGMLTYKNKHQLHKLAAEIQEDKFMFETDAPYLPPEGFRGQINTPAMLVEVVKKFAELRGIPVEKAADLSYSNTCTLFNI